MGVQTLPWDSEFLYFWERVRLHPGLGVVPRYSWGFGSDLPPKSDQDGPTSETSETLTSRDPFVRLERRVVERTLYRSRLVGLQRDSLTGVETLLSGGRRVREPGR